MAALKLEKKYSPVLELEKNTVLIPKMNVVIVGQPDVEDTV